jgi:hypothetical protein
MRMDTMVRELAYALRIAQPLGPDETAAFCVGFLFQHGANERLVDELTAERFGA